MPGQVTGVRVAMGQAVSKGDILLTLEAMKMEHRILAPYDGVVSTIHYKVGDSVQHDEVLLDLKPANPED
jgi:biotin carboxyl carrier protein